MDRLRHITRGMKRNGHLPVATLVLFLLNVAFFIWEASEGSTESVRNAVTLRYGMYRGALEDGEWIRLFAHGFFHFGIMHLASNMFCLWMYGVILETRIGSWKFAVIYAVSILGSGLLVNFAGEPRTLHAGASGAVWGLMTAMLIYSVRNGLDMSYPLRGIILNLIYSFSGANVSWQGHIGGGIAGLLAALILCGKTRNRRLEAYQDPYRQGADEAERDWRDRQDG